MTHLATPRSRTTLLGRAARGALAAALAGLVAACSAESITTTSGPATVSLTGPQQAAATPVAGRTRCDYPVTLEVGPGTGSVALTGLTLEWRALDGRALFPAEQISSIELGASDWFSASSFSGPASRTADRWTAGETPHQSFTMVHTLRYRVGSGAEQTATYTLSCQ